MTYIYIYIYIIYIYIVKGGDGGLYASSATEGKRVCGKQLYNGRKWIPWFVFPYCCIIRQWGSLSWLKVTTHAPSSPSSVYLWSIHSLCQSKSRPTKNTNNVTPAAGMLFYANSDIRNLHKSYVSFCETRDWPTITSAFGSEHIFYCPTRKAQSYTLWSRR